MVATTAQTQAEGLTTRSGVELARAIRSGETSAREVLEAHIEVLERRNPELNALVATRLDEARAEADAADARVAAAGDDEELPPLLGVPVTIKESFALAGMPHTSGSVHRRDVIAERSATVVQRLIDAGAIPLGVTNVSELTMWIEAENRVWGRTNNAYDQRRTAGGSSGGEGAAIGAGIAPIGIGSDFGGSIRLPAFFNGCFGHKPTGCVVPTSGHYPSANERGARMIGIGPLARSAVDLMPVLRTIAGPDGEDEAVRPVKLGDPADVSIEGLRVVISDDISVIPASVELRNARIRAARALHELGADVVRVSLPSVRTVVEPYLNAVRESGAIRQILVESSGTDLPPVRRLLADAVRGRSTYTTALLLTIVSENLAQYLPEALQRRALAAERALAREVTEVIGDGVLLHLPFPRVAPRHGRTVGRPWVLASTALFNLLGLPATQVPLGLNEKGLPLGVQVAAGRDRDHVAIAVAMALERAFGGWVPPQR